MFFSIIIINCISENYDEISGMANVTSISCYEIENNNIRMTKRLFKPVGRRFVIAAIES